MRNLHFSDAVRSEQELYENIVIESLQMYGQDVYYLPRDVVHRDLVLGDEVESRFNSAYKLEMYIENTDGFDGEGDLFTKFGVEIRDQASFVVARRRWKDTVLRYENEITGDRPREGDLIFLPMSKSLFEITHVEHEKPFYQLRNLPTYKLQCELFEWSDEDFDVTGVPDLETIERDYAYSYNLIFAQSQALAAAALDGRELGSISLVSNGSGYPSVPNVTITNQPAVQTVTKFGNNSFHPSDDIYTLSTFNKAWPSESHRGTVEFWVYFDSFPTSGYHQLLKMGNPNHPDGGTYENTFLVNSEGVLYAKNSAFNLIVELSNITDAPTLTTNTWHHIKITSRGTTSGLSNRTTQIYIDGQIVYRTNTTNNAFLTQSYTLGGEDQVNEFGFFDGYIDDFFATSNNPDYSDTTSVPTQAYTGNELGAVDYENFNTVPVTATCALDTASLTSITFTGNHPYFALPPTVTVAVPSTIKFTEGEIIQQTLTSGVVISAEVAEWSVDRSTLKAIHVASSDGKYHDPVTTVNVVGLSSETALPPTSVQEAFQATETQQNDAFETDADGFLDFTENNPFGDPNEA